MAVSCLVWVVQDSRLTAMFCSTDSRCRSPAHHMTHEHLGTAHTCLVMCCAVPAKMPTISNAHSLLCGSASSSLLWPTRGNIRGGKSGLAKPWQSPRPPPHAGIKKQIKCTDDSLHGGFAPMLGCDRMSTPLCLANRSCKAVCVMLDCI